MDTNNSQNKQTMTLDDIHDSLANSGIAFIAIPIDNIVTQYAQYRGLDPQSVADTINESGVQVSSIIKMFEGFLSDIISNPRTNMFKMYEKSFEESVRIASIAAIDSLCVIDRVVSADDNADGIVDDSTYGVNNEENAGGCEFSTSDEDGVDGGGLQSMTDDDIEEMLENESESYRYDDIPYTDVSDSESTHSQDDVDDDVDDGDPVWESVYLN